MRCSVRPGRSGEKAIAPAASFPAAASGDCPINFIRGITVNRTQKASASEDLFENSRYEQREADAENAKI
jgi:hypothetical protein